MGQMTTPVYWTPLPPPPPPSLPRPEPDSNNRWPVEPLVELLMLRVLTLTVLQSPHPTPPMTSEERKNIGAGLWLGSSLVVVMLVMMLRAVELWRAVESCGAGPGCSHLDATKKPWLPALPPGWLHHHQAGDRTGQQSWLWSSVVCGVLCNRNEWGLIVVVNQTEWL